MKRRYKRTAGITRLSEGESVRSTIRSSILEGAHQEELGKFCAGCDKWHSYLRQHEKLCVGCFQRFKAIYGDKSED